MARFFFDVTYGEQAFEEEEGSDLENVESVRAIALETLLETVGRRAPTADHTEVRVAVRDETGASVYRAVLTIAGEWPCDVD